MVRNKLSDLNNHLFAQLERLSDEELSAEELQKEVARAKAINGIAKNIIDNAKTALDGVRIAYSHIPNSKQMPEQFKLKEGE
jgi:hypothetical protein